MVAEAAAIVAARGIDAFSMDALGEALGAPMGSIYYRFDSRDALLGQVWLSEVERFQAYWASAADQSACVGELAAATVVYARRHRARARVLMLHRADEFLGDDVPESVRARALRLNATLPRTLRELSARWCGSARTRDLGALRFAVIDVPLAAVRPYLEQDQSIPAWMEDATSAAAEAAWMTGRQA